MGKNPVTASERRGVIAIAFLALAITGSALWLAKCGRVETEVTPQEVELLLDGRNIHYGSDSAAVGNTRSAREKKKKEISGRKGKSKAGKKTPHENRDRQMLDEPAD